MAEQVTGVRAGAPDFSEPGRFRVGKLRTTAGTHFTDALAQNGIEEENISGLPTNRVIISSVTINAKENLHYRLSFWSKDGFSNSDLGEDAFLGSVDLDLTRYGATNETDL